MTKQTLFILALPWALASCGRPPELAGEQPAARPDFVQSADSEALIDTREEIRKSGASMENARAKAESYIENALHRASDPSTRGLLSKMAKSLKTAKLDVPPPGRDLKTCAEESAVLAFVNLFSPHTIHVCARAAGASEKKLSQVLVHETAHVAGVHDECDATRIEVAVMRASGGRLPFHNGYMKNCGIR